MAHYRVGHPVFNKHARGNHAGVGPLLLPVHVLGGHGNASPGQVARQGWDRGKRRSNHHLSIRRQVLDQWAEGSRKDPRFFAGHVHLPVAGNHSLAHPFNPSVVKGNLMGRGKDPTQRPLVGGTLGGTLSSSLRNVVVVS